MDIARHRQHVIPASDEVLPAEAGHGQVVTSKGQVTIPKSVRDHLGIELGSTVDFELSPDGRVVLSTPAGMPKRCRFAGVRGRATAGMSTDQIMALTRGDD